jgi:hypothetical protein
MKTKGKGSSRMNKGLMTALVVLGVVVVAQAQQSGLSGNVTNTQQPVLDSSSGQTGSIHEAGSLGAGVLLGEPMGVSVKYWLSDKTAIDGGAGWSFAAPDGFQLHGDFLFHKFDLFHVGEGELPLYFGVGGRVKFVENGDNRAGIRGPVGISYLFPNWRWELFAEVAPTLDLAPFTRLEWNGGIGLRYYFR